MTIESPCRQICRLGPDDRCDGCGRTGAEIGAWLWLSDGQRWAVMERVRNWAVRPMGETSPGGDSSGPEGSP